MFSAAVIFGGFAAVKLLHHDLNNGLWSFAVCSALVLGFAAVVDGSYRREQDRQAGEVQLAGGVTGSGATCFLVVLVAFGGLRPCCRYSSGSSGGNFRFAARAAPDWEERSQ